MGQADEVGMQARVSVLGVSVETDNLLGLFRVARRRQGPFLIIGRDCGLALDTAFHTDRESAPHLWTPHGQVQQLWFVMRTPHRGEYTIVSAANNMALDARTWDELPREPVMWPRHSEPHQRWRFHRLDDGVGYVIESVLTGQVLDCPWGAERKTRPCMWDWHGEFNQQFVVCRIPSGPRVPHGWLGNHSTAV